MYSVTCMRLPSVTDFERWAVLRLRPLMVVDRRGRDVGIAAPPGPWRCRLSDRVGHRGSPQRVSAGLDRNQ